MLDKNEAPPGCEAVEFVHCRLCEFHRADCSSIACQASQREDNTSVHFIKKPEPEPNDGHILVIHASIILQIY